VPNLDIAADEASIVYVSLKLLKDFFSGRDPDATSSCTQDLGQREKWETCLNGLAKNSSQPCYLSTQQPGQDLVMPSILLIGVTQSPSGSQQATCFLCEDISSLHMLSYVIFCLEV